MVTEPPSRLGVVIGVGVLVLVLLGFMLVASIDSNSSFLDGLLTMGVLMVVGLSLILWRFPVILFWWLFVGAWQSKDGERGPCRGSVAG